MKVVLLGYDGDLEFERTVEMIAEHSARWRSAVAQRRYQGGILEFVILKCVADRLPLLENLSVDVAEEASRSSSKRLN